MYLLSAVSGGSGTELCVSALRLGQRPEYRVAGLAHRRVLSYVPLFGSELLGQRSAICTGSRKTE
ncbi:uncharacterized protein RMCB_4511 [Mycolicibacterium brisbanense]|uniref:Uncharacterized protein n=1 Tax=Mycolicibacterium brisbanense TaxID=146020 RepID=A0A100W2F2_9MYCO|nr:uncharacterized protein RMCB_4511 [Mycolicibacterium brisbanense]